uniref:Uncharacterized protein n=1 Tax=Oryza brachyantha TaxID=4533 RepID=J3M9D6_ORYBR
MDASSSSKLLLLFHVVLLAPLIKARPLGHGRLQVAPLTLPSDGAVVTISPPEVGGVGRPGPRPVADGGASRRPSPLENDDGGVLERPSPTPPSPVPGGSIGQLSDGVRRQVAPPSPTGNPPPHNHCRTDPLRRLPAAADSAPYLLGVIRDAVQYMIAGVLEA